MGGEAAAAAGLVGLGDVSTLWDGILDREAYDIGYEVRVDIYELGMEV